MNLTLRDRLSHYCLVLQWYVHLIKMAKHPSLQLFDLLQRDLSALLSFGADTTTKATKATVKTTVKAAVGTAKAARYGWAYFWLIPICVLIFLTIALFYVAGGKKAARGFYEAVIG